MGTPSPATKTATANVNLARPFVSARRTESVIGELMFALKRKIGDVGVCEGVLNPNNSTEQGFLYLMREENAAAPFETKNARWLSYGFHPFVVIPPSSVYDKGSSIVSPGGVRFWEGEMILHYVFKDSKFALSAREMSLPILPALKAFGITILSPKQMSRQSFTNTIAEVFERQGNTFDIDWV